MKTKDGKTVEGRMIEATDTNLTLSRDKKVMNISRGDIQQISHSTGKAAKGKWALIGTAAGAGAGAGLGGIKYDSRMTMEYIPLWERSWELESVPRQVGSLVPAAAHER